MLVQVLEHLVEHLTEIHNVVAADGAVVNCNVPCPQGHRVPLLDFEPFLPIVGSVCRSVGLFGLDACRWRGVCHLYVGHADVLAVALALVG